METIEIKYGKLTIIKELKTTTKKIVPGRQWRINEETKEII